MPSSSAALASPRGGCVSRSCVAVQTCHLSSGKLIARVLDGNVVFGDLSESGIKPPLFTAWPKCEKEPLQARDPAEMRHRDTPPRCRRCGWPCSRTADPIRMRRPPSPRQQQHNNNTRATISGPDPGEIYADGHRHKCATTLQQVLVLEKTPSAERLALGDSPRPGSPPKPKAKKKFG